MTSARILALAATIIVLAGCGLAVQPDESERVLHISNRINSAAVIQGANTTDRRATMSSVLMSCGATLDFDPSRNGLTFGDYEVAVRLDPSGGLDAAIERANGNLAVINTSALSMPVYWSRSGLKIVDLPQWITITPDGVTMSGQGPAAGSVYPPCDPFGASPEPSTP